MDRKRVKIGLTVLLLSLLYVGWRLEQRRQNAPKPDPATTVWHEWQGQNGGHTGVTPVIVRDPHAWKDLWDKVYGVSAYKPSLPSIDFDRHMVVAVFGGQGDKVGYRVAITGAAREGDTLTVTYRTTTEFGSRPGIVRPYHMAVYQSAPQVKFIKE